MGCGASAQAKYVTAAPAPELYSGKQETCVETETITAEHVVEVMTEPAPLPLPLSLLKTCHFLKALHDEYVEGDKQAVVAFRAAQHIDQNSVLDASEEIVRNSADKGLAIKLLMDTWSINPAYYLLPLTFDEMFLRRFVKALWQQYVEGVDREVEVFFADVKEQDTAPLKCAEESVNQADDKALAVKFLLDMWALELYAEPAAVSEVVVTADTVLEVPNTDVLLEEFRPAEPDAAAVIEAVADETAEAASPAEADSVADAVAVSPDVDMRDATHVAGVCDTEQEPEVYQTATETVIEAMAGETVDAVLPPLSEPVAPDCVADAVVASTELEVDAAAPGTHSEQKPEVAQTVTETVAEATDAGASPRVPDSPLTMDLTCKLLEALTAQYLEGVDQAVRCFLNAEQVENQDIAIAAIEEFERNSDDKAGAVQLLRNRWAI